MQTLGWPLIREAEPTPTFLHIVKQSEDTGLVGMLMFREESENLKFLLMELKHILSQKKKLTENVAFH